MNALVNLGDAVEARAYASLYAAAPAALRERFGLESIEHAGATLLFAPGLGSALFNRVIGLGLARPATDADIDFVSEAYARRAARPWWLHLSPGAAPADLAQRLAARGYTPPARRSWVRMLYRKAEPPEVACELALARADADGAAAAARAIVQAFSMPPIVADWIAALHGHRHWRVYAARDAAGAVVGGACLYLHDGAAWLGMGAIAPAQRGRGGQRGLLALRIAEALAAGCRAIVTETGEPIDSEPNPSLANMRRVGFEAVASRLNLQAPPAAVSASG